MWFLLNFHLVYCFPSAPASQEIAVRALAVRLLGQRASEFTLTMQPNTDEKHYALVRLRSLKPREYMKLKHASVSLPTIFYSLALRSTPAAALTVPVLLMRAACS